MACKIEKMARENKKLYCHKPDSDFVPMFLYEHWTSSPQNVCTTTDLT